MNEYYIGKVLKQGAVESNFNTILLFT